MMNKKLIALFITIATVGAISADCYIDRYGNERCDGVVENAGYGAGEAVATSGDVVAGTVGGLFGGRGVRERVEDRHDRRESRRESRQERREARREARRY